MMKLKQNEIQLIGGWKKDGVNFIEDLVSQRINWLIEHYLIKIVSDETGWFTLYKDPEDGRYWELGYPESEIHGGGAPILTNLSKPDVIKRYKI